MTKVLVTGGAGFIGSHIVDLLIRKGYSVVIVDNLSTGNKKNINSQAKFYLLDLTNLDLLRKVFIEEKPQFVYHVAAQVNVRKSVNDPIFDAKTNILGSINVLECCKEFKVEKIIYSSSGGACYGEPEYLPCDETHPVNPMCQYGITKHTVEHYLYLYHKLYGLNYVILRYANVFGPRQDPSGEAGVVSIFIEQIKSNKVCKIFGDGEQTRDYVYVEDVARANLLALEKMTISRMFNLGTGIPTSVNQIFFLLQELTHKGSKEHVSPVLGEIKDIHLDYSLAEKELGWKPTMGLKEGLSKILEQD
ncbi:MAG: NAD-dependent epimerase/dehydratase family protein [Candidatus Woesearchaeota archaeon]|jgi:UDP-glucose 4-epimerase